ncbi:hypothetical protein A2Z22_01375 [Candidatus Woesebacteria bacterium RBG_16_34_12]|uniref:OmpR/PhoB-type domain-containing protein n=1 Tax=Candidatus Woesebacteria bacterium RBG_16_34_12 TaxID=1802480 RepID=A0A1F7XA12_9BACT|nr:MAG: hypothetical protein A2Z22_01375 [Candidatus Woesebacteria bacterium RBG_16_34_12]
MPYNLKERKLDSHFCKEDIQNVKKLINSSVSFTIVGMPGVGISIFLRYLTTKKGAHFVHVDIYELTKLNKLHLFKLLLKELGVRSKVKQDEQILLESCKKQLKIAILKHKKVVIAFNRLDQLKDEFDIDFFNNLRTLRDIDKEKIVMIFTANKPLSNYLSKKIDIGNLYMYSKTYYFKPYSKKDLKRLLKVNAPDLKVSKKFLTKALTLSGGHYQLLLLLLNSEIRNNPILDQFIKLQLNKLYDNLNYLQKKQVVKIAQKKKILKIDKSLTNLGLIKLYKGSYRIFTPLLDNSVLTNLIIKFTPKESVVYKLLKKNIGKIVYKEDLFDALWENPEKSSDWALNSIIYRLRKNPAFINYGYIIENHKKIGYSLAKI